MFVIELLSKAKRSRAGSCCREEVTLQTPPDFNLKVNRSSLPSGRLIELKNRGKS